MVNMKKTKKFIVLFLLFISQNLFAFKNDLILQTTFPQNVARITLFYLNDRYQEKFIVVKKPESNNFAIDTITLEPNTLIRYSVMGTEKKFVEQVFLLPKTDTLKLVVDDKFYLSAPNQATVFVENYVNYYQYNNIFSLPPHGRDIEAISGFLTENNKKISNSKIDVEEKRILNNIALADYYTRGFTLAFEKNDMKLATRLYQGLSQHKAQLQSNVTHFNKRIFYDVIRYQGYQHGKKQLSLSDKVQYSIKANWDRVITVSYLIFALNESGRLDKTLVKEELKKVVEYSGMEFFEDLEKVKRKILPALSSMESIFLVNQFDKEDNLKQILIADKPRLIVMEFGASWCVPCREEMPYFLKMKKHYSSKNVKFVNLSLDKDIDHSKWLKSLQETNAQSETNQFRLKDVSKKQFFSSINISSVPKFVVLDGKGKILETDFERPKDEQVFRKKLDALILHLK